MDVKGFTTSAVAAGIKYQERLDLGLIVSTAPAVTAGVFTTNQVKAAPVLLDMERLKNGGRAQAILVNSGCANACTGEAGMAAAVKSSALVAQALTIPEPLVQLSSTGVIGSPLNVAAIEAAMDRLVAGLGDDNFAEVAQAIMTTDTVRKIARKTVMIDGTEVTLMGMAKGAGMIMPNMATMLAFVLTDARIDHPQLQEALQAGVARTFNRITVDGDTSTNDMVLVMASGEAGNSRIDAASAAPLASFTSALEALLKELALMIVADGEGASKCITIRVCGAREEQEAERLARTVANSSLVKTAFFGEDANWGRILAAMGRSGVRFRPEGVDIAFDEVGIVRDGLAVGASAEEEAAGVLKKRQFTVSIDLKEGSGRAEIYTCDFSIDYVKINADYRT
ncbi:MAG: bifunctional glutamate N-acetyltransferase/amino-acid acetyltransferase ArgJ [Desulfopila sp.]